MTPGKFFVFEGIDGSGKTTQSKALLGYLSAKGFETRWFREPGDSAAGRRIRELASNNEPLSAEDELALFITDRKENIKTNLKPNIEAGRMVILDRYYFSTVCYQAVRGMDPERILADHQAFAPRPDLAVYIDVEVKTALERINKSRSERAIRFENEEFLTTVRQNYLDLCLKGHLVKVDGNRSEEAVWQDIRSLCDTILMDHR